MDRFTFHQTPEELIKSASPETRIAWNNLLLLCGERMSISQVFYQGLIAGSEFLTYRAGRLWFALEIEFGHLAGSTVTTAYIAYYNETNVNTYAHQNNGVAWDTTAANMEYQYFTTLSKNLYFSRFTTTAAITMMKFIGFKITY